MLACMTGFWCANPGCREERGRERERVSRGREILEVERDERKERAERLESER